MIVLSDTQSAERLIGEGAIRYDADRRRPRRAPAPQVTNLTNLWGANTQPSPRPGHCPKSAWRRQCEDERVQIMKHRS